MKKIAVLFLIHCASVAVTSELIIGCEKFRTFDLNNTQIKNSFSEEECQRLANDLAVLPNNTYICQVKKCQCFGSFSIEETQDFLCYEGKNGNLTCSYLPNASFDQETVDAYDDQDSIYLTVKKDTNDLYILVESKESTEESERSQESKDATIVKAVSAFCLILTIAVHLNLPSHQIRHFKYCIYSYICLAITLIILCIEYLLHSKKEICRRIGYIGYYCAMATFLWLCVINYNLWIQFKSIGQKEVSILKSHIFVWGVAGILYLITYLVDIFNAAKLGDGLSYTLWKPGFGDFSCWIKTSQISGLIFYYGPISVLLFINTILMTSMGWSVYMTRKHNTRSLNDCARKAENNAKFFSILRYFVVAGLIWILEIFIQLNQLFFGIRNLCWLDYIPTSQGIMIFVTTVLRKKVFKDLYSRFLIARSRRI